MGAMKDLGIESMNLSREWEHLLARILGQPNVGKAYVMKPDEMPDDEDAWKEIRLVPDIVFEPVGTDGPVAVEFKMFRWEAEWPRRVRDAIVHMQEILDQGRYRSGTIILSVEVPDEQLEEIRSTAGPDIGIWTLANLTALASADDALAEALDGLAIETIMDWPLASPRSEKPDMQRGTAIAARLRSSPAGAAGWQTFETECAEAVKHLFGRDLHNPVAQQRTDGGLHRMDLICRIRSEGSSFWSMIASDFSTRYVVFDAKNHRDPISQNEVEVTGKYLVTKGLRTVAIIIARQGAAKGAEDAAAQILREAGKFILVVDLAELCAMLEGADAGDPPENLLFEKMDRMLMRITR